MKKIITAVIFSLLLSSSCFSETVTSHVNERGQTVYTNSGPSASKQEESTKEKTKSAANEIFTRHPEFDDAKVERMILLRDHFINFGNPPDRALLKAEKKMIEDGALIDHEAVAAAKMAAEEASQREMVKAGQREKREKRRREILEQENVQRQQAEEVANEQSRQNEQHYKHEAPHMSAADFGASYAPAAGGRVNTTTGSFQAKTAGGYVDTQSGAFHAKTAGGTVNTQTGQFSPGQ